MQPTIINHTDYVFVYGSNLAGVNGAGAASTAKRFYGAVDGVGEGMSGEHCYALPTKDENINTRDIHDVYASIDTFLSYASAHPNKKFMLTRVGCGLAGFTDEQLLSHIRTCSVPDNVLLPGIWLNALGQLDEYRIIVAGGREFNQLDMMTARLTKLFSQLDKPVTIISGGAPGADSLGEACADRIDTVKSLVRFPAQWTQFNKPAGFLRNAAMSFYSSHAVVFWNGQSRGSKDMIKRATDDKLHVRVCRY